jgi:hypothetical protein
VEAAGIEPTSLRAAGQKLLPCIKSPRGHKAAGVSEAIPHTVERLTCVDVCQKRVNQNNRRCSESETLRAFCRRVLCNSSALETRSVNTTGFRPRPAAQISISFI